MHRLLVEIVCRAAKPQLADYHHLRAAGCRKRGVPERPELDILSASALAIFRARRPRSAPRRPGLGVSLPPAVSADAEGRCPSRAEGTRPGRRAGPGAGARACARARARQKLRSARGGHWLRSVT
ncbi:hypothetical protein R6Z07F_005891 [Ovis aries]